MSVKRINILNSPTGSVATYDKYQFLFGMFVGSPSPIGYKRRFNKYTKKFDKYLENVAESQIKKVQLFNIFKFKLK